MRAREEAAARVKRRRPTEQPERTERLRLALALGRRAALVAANATLPHTQPTCTGPPLLAAGVITAPSFAERRVHMRRALTHLKGADRCAVSMQFILGDRGLAPLVRARLAQENQRHGDLLFLRSHDGKSPGMSHGGRAVAAEGP